MATALKFPDFLPPLDARLRRNANVIGHLASRYPVVADSSLAQLVRPSDEEEPIQRWFHYREGYTIELCKRYITADDSLILDPFCGFGSTLLASKQQGVEAVGFDVNPLAVFVAKAKTATYSPDDLGALEALKYSLRRAEEPRDHGLRPALRILPKMFNVDILAALATANSIIESVSLPRARQLARLCWLSILESVSNVYREGNGLKYRNRIRRGNVYTVVPMEEWANSAFPDDKFEFVMSRLNAALDIAVADATSRCGGPEPRVVEEDSSQLSKYVQPESITSAIFSPPYCNCFNYIKAYKLELWMGGFIRAYSDIPGLTERGIRSRVESILTPATTAPNRNVEAIAQLVSEGELWSGALPSVVRGYFTDMARLLAQVHSVLVPGGAATIVVGNSALAGVLIPTDLLLAEIAEQSGFRVKRIVAARHLTTSSQQKLRLEPLKPHLRESVIELTK
jgi:DNA modification methylase